MEESFLCVLFLIHLSFPLQATVALDDAAETMPRGLAALARSADDGEVRHEVSRLSARLQAAERDVAQRDRELAEVRME